MSSGGRPVGGSEPTVSVITITFRDLEGLRATRDSVCAQEYAGSIEHVVIDGGSGAAVETFLGKSGVDAWVSEPDGGRYHAMNKGIERASGDVFWFMNSGDTFGSSRAVAAAMGALTSPRSQWGHGLARLVDAEHGFRGVFGIYPFDRFRFTLGGRQVPHQAAFFGADVVRRVGGYPTNSGLSADQHFMLECALIAEPVFVPDFLADFDASGVGTTRNPRESFREMRAYVSHRGLYGGLCRVRWRVLSRVVESVYLARVARAAARTRRKRAHLGIEPSAELRSEGQAR